MVVGVGHHLGGEAVPEAVLYGGAGCRFHPVKASGQSGRACDSEKAVVKKDHFEGGVGFDPLCQVLYRFSFSGVNFSVLCKPHNIEGFFDGFGEIAERNLPINVYDFLDYFNQD